MKSIFSIFALFFSIIFFQNCKKNQPLTPEKISYNNVSLLSLEYGRGYLILDKLNNPNVFRWHLSIYKREFISSEKFSDQKISNHILKENQNYFLVPEKYRINDPNRYFFIRVQNFDENNQEISTFDDIPINNIQFLEDASIPKRAPGTPSFHPTGCMKTCVGSTYAYSIVQYKRHNINLSHLAVEPAFQAFDIKSKNANPYYWYSKKSFGPYADPTAKVTFTSGGVGNVTVRDPAGNVLTGLVYGYKKYMGDWKGYPYIRTKNPLTIGDEFCSNNTYSLNRSIITMNAYGNFKRQHNAPRPPLTCTPMANFNIPTNNYPVKKYERPDIWEGYITFYFCLQDGVLKPCDDQEPTSQIYLNPGNVDQIQIKDLNDPNFSTISINIGEQISNISNGSFEELNFTLEPGLFFFGFLCTDGTLRYGIKEIKETFKYSLTDETLMKFANKYRSASP